MERLNTGMKPRHCTNFNPKFAHNIPPSKYTLRQRCATHAQKTEEVSIKKWGAGCSRVEDDMTGTWLWRNPGENCLRRRVLAGMAWPFFIITMGRQATDAIDITEDPAEMAVVAALDARDMLPVLSTFLLQAKAKLGPSSECNSRLKSLNRIYERLKVNLPILIEELEINEEFAEQLLQGLAYVEDDLCSRTIVSSTLSENSSISRVNVDGSLKLLKLARSKVDILLQKVPRQLLESAQLARGVRPMA